MVCFAFLCILPVEGNAASVIERRRCHNGRFTSVDTARLQERIEVTYKSTLIYHRLYGYTNTNIIEKSVLPFVTYEAIHRSLFDTSIGAFTLRQTFSEDRTNSY